MKVRTAVLLIDFLNHLEFDGGQALLPSALQAAHAARKLRRKATSVGASIIYVNDNFGDWRADRNGIYRKCMRRGIPGAPIARIMKPRTTDYFVLKARHSAFYCSTLEPLLENLEVKQLVLAGLTADMCVLFTANDAYVRKFKLAIPRDCTAAINTDDYRGAIRYFQNVLGANTQPSTSVRF